MKTIGVSCFYHDSAVAAVEDGEIRFAIHEERISRRKQDSGFPHLGFQRALNHCGWDIREVDCVAFYERPSLKLERLLWQMAADWPRTWGLFSRKLPEFLSDKYDIENIIRASTGYAGEIRLHEHHYSHAASVFYTSPFERALVLTIDGVGEWDCLAVYQGDGNRLRKLKSIQFPHSLGLLYSIFTKYLGFKVNSGEYKVMGMACYGKPRFKDKILSSLIHMQRDGSFTLNQRFFNFSHETDHARPAFHRLFGIPPREPESDIDTEHFDLAASIQEALEDVVLNMLRALFREYGKQDICLAGGVALNCTMNARITKELGVVPHIHAASGDAGGALGCALSSQIEDRIETFRCDFSPYLGSEFSDQEVLETFKRRNVRSTRHENIHEVLGKLIADGKVVAVHWGRDEWGPRALGNRSILANPTMPEMQDRLNEKIKFREKFRPFAPIVLEEHFSEFFDPLGAKSSPHMLFTYPVKRPKDIPSVTHVNRTGRVQTVNEREHPGIYSLIRHFAGHTGIPVIINTSFNLRGEPIVHSPDDALNTFLDSGIDYLAVNNFLVSKKDNKAAVPRSGVI